MSNKNEWALVVDNENVNIASGETESDVLEVRGGTLCGLYIPAGFTGTTVELTASHDGVNYIPVQDGAGNNLSFTVSPSIYVPIDPASTVGLQNIKLVSGSAESSERVVVAAVRKV